jgi:hypothetical protein
MTVYDEGTWTPVITCAAGTITTLTYTVQAGKYTRIGNVVLYAGAITVDAFTIGTGSGDMRVSLPITCFNDTGSRAAGSIQLSGLSLQAATANVTVHPTANQAYCRIVESLDNAAAVATQIGALAAGDSMNYAGIYFAA